MREEQSAPNLAEVISAAECFTKFGGWRLTPHFFGGFSAHLKYSADTAFGGGSEVCQV
jgi:hypothetical protein